MSFLDALPRQIASAIGADLRPGSLYVNADGGTDNYGNSIRGEETAHPIRGIVESFSAYLGRSGNSQGAITSEASVERGDMAFLFLLHGVPVDPTPGDQISIDGPRGKGIRYRIITVAEIDPARAHCVVQAREM